MAAERCGAPAEYSPENAEVLRFEEEIRNLIHPCIGSSPPPGSCGSSSFTALLGLPSSEAVELLHNSEPAPPPPWRLPLGFSPDPALSAPPTKAEPADSSSPPSQYHAKRKDCEWSKAKGAAKRSRSMEDKHKKSENAGEKLPYVHVRARRGQATDSHSLAERARREKINARMKLLQELVPGCSKISGTALVLDEIINHVQLLQRQVELLSMKLAAVNPSAEFGTLGGFLSTEQCGRITTRTEMMMWHSDMVEHPLREGTWEREEGILQRQQQFNSQGHVFMNSPAVSMYAYDSPDSVSLRSDQLKAEL